MWSAVHNLQHERSEQLVDNAHAYMRSGAENFKFNVHNV